MITAISLLTVQRDKVASVAQQLAEIEGVSEVYSVSGRYDLVSIIRAKDSESMSELVTGHMLKVDGIMKSETLMAFRVYSRYDLEHMFSIGKD